MYLVNSFFEGPRGVDAKVGEERQCKQTVEEPALHLCRTLWKDQISGKRRWICNRSEGITHGTELVEGQQDNDPNTGTLMGGRIGSKRIQM